MATPRVVLYNFRQKHGVSKCSRDGHPIYDTISMDYIHFNLLHHLHNSGNFSGNSMRGITYPSHTINKI